MTETQAKVWGRIFRRMTRQCPRCRQTWLLLNTHAGGRHTCKACGCRFAAPDAGKPPDIGEDLRRCTGG